MGRLVPTAVLVLALGLGTAAARPPSSAAPRPGAVGIGDPYFPGDGNGGYDVQRYRIRNVVGFARGRLWGHTRITATATQDLSRLNLDFVLPVRSVRVDGRRARFRKPTRHELQVTPAEPVADGERFTVRVAYAGRPKAARWRGERPWRSNDHEVLAAGEPQIAAWWFPANDHPRDKARFDIGIRVRRGHRVVANGEPDGRTRSDRWVTWRWRATEPMAPYLAFFTAGRFRVERGTTAAGTPYTYAVSRRLGRRATRRAMAFLRRTPRTIAYLERWLGPYPFRSTGGVVSDVAGYALENQTRPTYPYVGGPGQDSLVAHEIAHQWVGDRVSVRGWRHIWLNEGIATYLAMRYADNDGYPSPRRWLLAQWRSHGPGEGFWRVRVRDPGRGRLFAAPVYDRGAMTIEALRQRIGDAALRELLRTWVTDRSHGTTRTFTTLAEQVSGEDLDTFFHAWLVARERPARTTANGLR